LLETGNENNPEHVFYREMEPGNETSFKNVFRKKLPPHLFALSVPTLSVPSSTAPGILPAKLRLPKWCY